MWHLEAEKNLCAYGPVVKPGDFGMVVAVPTGNGNEEIQICPTDEHDYLYVVNVVNVLPDGEVKTDDTFLYTGNLDAACQYAITLFHIATVDPESLQGMINATVR